MSTRRWRVEANRPSRQARPRRADYLRRNRRPIYTGLQLAGKLNAHLEEVDRQASEMMDLLIRQMAKREGVTEQLRVVDQMAWIGAMNSIRARSKEMVSQELICC